MDVERVSADGAQPVVAQPSLTADTGDGAGSRMRRVAKRQRPSVLRGHTRQIESPLGTMYVTINEDDESRPFEIFVTLGKAGGAAMADAEAIGRLCSLALSSGLSLRDIHKQLRGISSDRAVGFGPNAVWSGPDAVAQVIEKHLVEQESIQQVLPLGAETVRRTSGGVATTLPSVTEIYADEKSRQSLDTCPECSSGAVAHQEGCRQCMACGYRWCTG